MKLVTSLALMLLAGCVSIPEPDGPIYDFEGERLDAIAARFNEVNPSQRIEVSGRASAGSFSGYLQLNQPENLVRLVGASTDYRIWRRGNGFYIAMADE